MARGGLARREAGLPPRPVDRPAIVGIDEAKIPEVAALIDVGNSRCGQFQEALREAVHGAGRRDSLRRGGQRRAGRAGAVEDPVDAGGCRRLIVRIGAFPRGALLGLAQGLDLPGLEPVGEAAPVRLAQRAFAQGPAADDHLEECGAVGARYAIRDCFGAGECRADDAGPERGGFAQHGETGPEILAALVVVGRGGEERRRIAGEPPLRRLMKGIPGRQAPGIETDIDTRQEAAIAIEGGVLAGLCRQGYRELAEFPQRRAPPPARRRVAVAQDLADQPGQAAVGRMGVGRRPGDGVVERPGLAGLIGAVAAKADKHAAQHSAQRGHAVVAMRGIGLQQQRDGAAERFERGAEIALQQLAACLSLDRRKVPAVTADLAPECVERRLSRRGVEEQRHLVHEIVSARAVRAPAARQLLAGRENLLDDEIGRPRAGLRRALRIEAGEAAAQAPAIGFGIGQAVDMVDAETVDDALAIEAQQRLVRRLEDVGILDAQPGELADVEEAAPVDHVVGGAPPGQAIVLALQQGVEPAAAVRGGGVIGGKSLAPHGLGILRAQREEMIEMTQRDRRARFPARRPDLAGGERFAIGAAEKRHEHLAAQAGDGRGPVDVEDLRKCAFRAVRQHIEPPAVLVTANGHVVGHDIDDQAHATRPKRLRQGAQRILAAKLGIDLRGIDHVVAMHRSGTRLQDR